MDSGEQLVVSGEIRGHVSAAAAYDTLRWGVGAPLLAHTQCSVSTVEPVSKPSSCSSEPGIASVGGEKSQKHEGMTASP